MTRPGRDEYGGYYHVYVGRVPDGDIVETLAAQLEAFGRLMRGVPEERGGYRYAEGKWSVKEVLGHLVDTERVLGYRALAFARGDETPLPGFDQNAYVAGAGFDGRSIADLVDEFGGLRRSHLALFRSLDDEVRMRRGTASRFSFTTRAVAWIIAGHLIHHAAVLREAYGVGTDAPL
jgi:hypothetical protein